MPDIGDLRQKQALPLTAKIHMSQARIREWVEHWFGDAYVSFSGGKDSTVLAHLVHEYYPEIPLVFANTGLEYPEIQSFARKMGAEIIRPKMSFAEVISTYGYPIISKENAEAIYYARRIRNGGGYATAERKRTELNGARAGVSNPPEFNMGGVQGNNQKTDRHYKRLQLLGNHPSCAWGGYNRNRSDGTSSWEGTGESDKPG